MATLLRFERSDLPEGVLHHGKRVSHEEYSRLTDDGHLYDMIDGVLHYVPSGNSKHGETISAFVIELGIYLKRNRRGKVVSETDIYLPDGGDILRPDAYFVLFENVHEVLGYLHGTPDLICEVLSTSTIARDLGQKADRYLFSGVKEYWILDPRDQTVQVWFNRSKADQTAAWEKVRGTRFESRLLPGFGLDARTFFQQISPEH